MWNWFKWLVAGKELKELHRRRLAMNEYRRWLAEFELIATTLDNMETEVQGLIPVNISTPAGTDGPWDIQNLRKILRLKFKKV